MACVRKDEITFEKTISNMVECKSCGVYLMELMMAGNYNIEESAGFTVYIPETDKHFATSLVVIPLQLMEYYVSVVKELDVDKSRNLPKSVTVEQDSGEMRIELTREGWFYLKMII